MPNLHRFYTDYELTVLCEDCAAARKANGEHVQPAETPADWERPELTCYDCDAPDDAADNGRPADEADVRLECNFWVRGPGLCGWADLASEANWDPYYETYVCPRCGASDGLRIVDQTADAEPTRCPQHLSV